MDDEPGVLMVQVLAVLGAVGPGYGEAVLGVLEARREELRQALLQRTHLMSSSTLQDFDWQLKVPHHLLL